MNLDKRVIILYLLFVLLHFVLGQNESVSSKILKEGKVILMLSVEDPSLLKSLTGLAELDIVVRNQTKAKARFLGLAHRSVGGVVQTGEEAFGNEFGVEVFAESTVDGHVIAGDKLIKGSKLRLKSSELDFLAYVENIR